MGKYYLLMLLGIFDRETETENKTFPRLGGPDKMQYSFLCYKVKHRKPTLVIDVQICMECLYSEERSLWIAFKKQLIFITCQRETEFYKLVRKEELIGKHGWALL